MSTYDHKRRAAKLVYRAIGDLRSTDPEDDYSPDDIADLIARAEDLADLVTGDMDEYGYFEGDAR